MTKYISGEMSRTDDDQYAFMVKDCDPNRYTFAVSGVDLDMLIDSGDTSNIIDKVTWETLKSIRIVCHSYKSDKKLYAYASKEPLPIKGAFTCEIKCGK